MQATNQHALKSIKKSAEQGALRTGGKELSIPEGNLVLLWDHPESHNKIQDHFKDQEFVMVKQLHEPNVYWIKPVNGVSPEWVANCRQLQALQKAHDNNDNTNNEEVGNVPSFSPKVRLRDETPHTHRYATQAKGRPSTLVQCPIAGMGMDHSDRLNNNIQSFDHCPADVIIERTSL